MPQLQQGSSLPRSTPEQEGVSPDKIVSFLDAVAERKIELHSFMMLRHGKVVAEGWWKPYEKNSPHLLYSLSKSFTSTAIGFAVSEGLLTVEDLIGGYFKEDYPENPDEKLKQLKVKHLLSMSTGHNTDMTMLAAQETNWAKLFFDTPLEFEPGTHFFYNNLATYMLSALITKVTGKTTLDYLMPRLFEPLGIERPVWETCPKGYNTGGWGLALKTEDIAKFGLLYLNKGVYDGTRILSESWIEEATTKKVENGTDPESDWTQGYGYQFWRCRFNAYRGDGAFGQFCIVLPEKDAVIVFTSGVPDLQQVLNVTYAHLLPALGEELVVPASVQEESKASETSPALAARLSSLSYPPPVYMSATPLEKGLEELVVIPDTQADGFERVILKLKEHFLELVLEREGKAYKILAGRERWLEAYTELFMPMTPGITTDRVRTMGSFTWQSEDLLLVTLRLVDTPYTMKIRISLKEGRCTLNADYNLSFRGVHFFSFDGHYLF